MSIFNRIKSFEFDKNRTKILGIKSGIVWGTHITKNSSAPILYISKPKHVTQDEFEELLDSMQISFVKSKNN